MIIDMISCWYCKMYETLAVYSYILNNINMISCQLSLEEILVDKQLGWLCNVYFWRYKLKYLYGLGRLSWFIKRLLLATRVRSPTTWLDLLTAVNLLRRYDCIILIFRDFRILELPAAIIMMMRKKKPSAVGPSVTTWLPVVILLLLSPERKPAIDHS